MDKCINSVIFCRVPKVLFSVIMLATTLLFAISCTPDVFTPSKTLIGKGLFIWQLWNLPVNTNFDTAVELTWENDEGEDETHVVLCFDSLKKKLVKSGVSWIAVKLGDSNSFWLRENALIPRWLAKNNLTFDDFLDELHEIDVKVFGWSFVYGGSKWDSEPDEILVAKKIIDSGVDGFIVNAEIHLELINNPVSYTRNYFSSLKNYSPDTFLGYTTFAQTIKHLRFPYSEFAKYCDVFMPQNYWVDRNSDCDEFISPENEIRIFNRELQMLGKLGVRFTKKGVVTGRISYENIIPIGSVESELCKLDDSKRGKHINSSEIREFWQASRKHFPSGFSLWSADWMNNDEWEIFEKIKVNP